ncbi:PREDICTED: uncharacterized protein LOC108537280 isoform X2 [Rhinopithecus bieti]|uniref:uncharacterized protein LOC108537280 isoform X2 n=1 Tax=Rhinopithecus bieti TaxID=61621 RepID=UPI00083BD224|nr:PREDICTED: uncharacterized protein LOC108537280 isoform X2 [Rhinopithecus bieti]
MKCCSAVNRKRSSALSLRQNTGGEESASNDCGRKQEPPGNTLDAVTAAPLASPHLDLCSWLPWPQSQGAVHPSQLMKLCIFWGLIKPLMEPKNEEKADGIPERCLSNRQILFIKTAAGVPLALDSSTPTGQHHCLQSTMHRSSSGCFGLITHLRGSWIFPVSLRLPIVTFLTAPQSQLPFQGSVPRKQASGCDPVPSHSFLIYVS